jgi:hypothetical protein
MSSKPVRVVKTTVRLFSDDIATLKKIAEQKRSKFQIELRLLVHRALKGELAVGILRDR